jgi:hypothetical protein
VVESVDFGGAQPRPTACLSRLRRAGTLRLPQAVDGAGGRPSAPAPSIRRGRNRNAPRADL